MNFTLLGSIASLAYMGSSLLIFREVRKKAGNKYALYLAWVAVALHTIYNVENLIQYGNINFRFFSTASLVSLLVALMLLIAAIGKPVEKLGIALFPLAAIMLACNMLFPDNSQSIQTYDWKMHTHILSSIIAFSLLNIAAFQAILLAIQDHQLRKHNPKWLIQSLPPLQTMESLLFQMIMMGMAFLSVSLISGAIFVDDLFAQHLGHKTILSILAWIIFGGLLTGRALYGWRGQTAIRWTLIGFAALLLAYFGSKLVYEFIL
jgi:ABC-type uncharacterized transport system permease subunit